MDVLRQQLRRGQINQNTYREKATEITFLNMESIDYVYAGKLDENFHGVVVELKSGLSELKIGFRVRLNSIGRGDRKKTWKKIIRECVMPQLTWRHIVQAKQKNYVASKSQVAYSDELKETVFPPHAKMFDHGTGFVFITGSSEGMHSRGFHKRKRYKIEKFAPNSQDTIENTNTDKTNHKNVKRDDTWSYKPALENAEGKCDVDTIVTEMIEEDVDQNFFDEPIWEKCLESCILQAKDHLKMFEKMREYVNTAIIDLERIIKESAEIANECTLFVESIEKGNQRGVAKKCEPRGDSRDIFVLILEPVVFSVYLFLYFIVSWIYDDSEDTE